MTELQYSEAYVAAFVPQAVSFQGAEQRILKSVGTCEKRLKYGHADWCTRWKQRLYCTE